MSGRGEDDGMSEHLLRKWRVIGIYWIVQAGFFASFFVFWVMQGNTVSGNSGRPLGEWNTERLADILGDVEVWAALAVGTLALMALQAALVWPVRRPRGRAVRGWPLRLSILIAAFLGMLMAAALYAGLFTLLQVDRPSPSDGLNRVLMIGFWSWLGVSYVAGAVLMQRFCSRRLRAGSRHEDVLARLAATLFLGTLIEAVAILPIDVMYRRRENCYCAAGTFWAYAALVGVGLVTLGPAALLPALSRRRKRWYASRCDCCGYDMQGAIHADRRIDRCPECGAGWKGTSSEPGARTEQQLP